MKFASKLSCVLVALVFTASVSAQEPTVEPAPKAPEKQVLKTFKMKHITPQEALVMLQALTVPRLGAGFPAGVAPAATVATVAPPASMSANLKAKSLFVRGTTEQLKDIEKVLQAVDLPIDQIKAGEFSTGRIFPLKHASPQEVSSALQQLKIPALLLPISKGGLIFVSGTEAAADAAEVIKAIDIPDEKSDTKTANESPKEE